MQRIISPIIVSLGVALFLASSAVSVSAAPLLKTRYETQPLIASDRGPDDYFGRAVAISGNLAIVGATGEHSDAFSGAAYIFAFDGTSWNQQAKLTVAGSSLFGSAVAIAGDMALVGDPWDNTLGSQRGAVYVFTFDGTAWTQQAKLFGSDIAGDYSAFGRSIALLGDTAVFGAPGFSLPGAVYVFTFDGATWSEQAKLTGSDTASLDFFGAAVSLSENRILVGAYGKNTYSGAAYIFSSDGSTWTQEAKLTSRDDTQLSYFGWAVSVSGNNALIGQPNSKTGQAYLYAFDGTTWSEESKLKDPGAKAGDHFGSSVALSGKVALVGAHDFTDSGRVYAFSFRRNALLLNAQFLASDGVAGDYLGVSLALSGDTILAGADDTFDTDRGGEAYIFSLGR